MKQKIITLFAALVLMLTLTPAAQAQTMDLGHGSGCVHSHTSACKHSHNSSCYTSINHYVDPSQTEGAMNVQFSCTSCGTVFNEQASIYHCGSCSEWYADCPCPNCGRNVHRGWTSGDTCRRQLTCTISTSAYICGKDTYGDCVKPTITYMLPNQWTNQDVTVNYSGTTSGSLTFSDNGTQSVTVTSSTGHRIKEDITVDKIDKIAPVMPDYDYSK